MALLLTGCATARPVEKGAVYRAGPMNAEGMEHVINDNNIRTVINLRGFDPGKAWYQEQRQVCDRLDVDYVDCSLNTETPEREEVLTLLETMQRAPKPILIQGSNPWRNDGFAAGLYRVAVMRESNDKARKELALWQRAGWKRVPMATHDQLLKEWDGADHFAASSPAVVSVNAAWSGPDERDAPEQVMWFESDVFEETPPPAGSHTSAKVDLWENTVGETIKKEAETLSQELVQTIENPSDYLSTESGLTFESGRVFTDYSAFIVDGPVNNGPVLVGRKQRYLGKPPSRQTVRKAPVTPTKEPRRLDELPPPISPSLTQQGAAHSTVVQAGATAHGVSDGTNDGTYGSEPVVRIGIASAVDGEPVEPAGRLDPTGSPRRAVGLGVPQTAQIEGN